MNTRTPEIVFFLSALLLTGLLTALILLSYLQALVVAATLAVICLPGKEWLARTMPKLSKGLVAALTVMLALTVILVPLSLFGVRIASETVGFYGVISADGFAAVEQAAQALERRIPGSAEILLDAASRIDEYAREAAAWVVQKIGPVFSGVTRIGADIFVFIIAFYYFLKDGRRIRERIIRTLPLSRHNLEEIFDRLTATIYSVVWGSLVVAIVQGVAAGVGYYLFGVPNPALWGLATIFVAFIPFVGGAGAVVIAAVALLATGKFTSGIGLAIWGIAFVGLIDNVLRPYLLKDGVRIHPLLVLLSVIGGLEFFGPTGFVLGPMVLSLFSVLLEISPSVIQNRSSVPS